MASRVWILSLNSIYISILGVDIVFNFVSISHTSINNMHLLNNFFLVLNWFSMLIVILVLELLYNFFDEQSFVMGLNFIVISCCFLFRNSMMNCTKMIWYPKKKSPQSIYLQEIFTSMNFLKFCRNQSSKCLSQSMSYQEDCHWYASFVFDL